MPNTKMYCGLLRADSIFLALLKKISPVYSRAKILQEDFVLQFLLLFHNRIVSNPGVPYKIQSNKGFDVMFYRNIE